MINFSFTFIYLYSYINFAQLKVIYFGISNILQRHKLVESLLSSESSLTPFLKSLSWNRDGSNGDSNPAEYILV
jgi:hypothetical protein